MNLKIAVQKKGRLQEQSLHLLKECGLDFEVPSANHLKIVVKNFFVDIYLLRNSDIPKYINDGVMDAGILGENTIVESNINLELVKKLNFGKCRVSLALPKTVSFTDLNFFQNKTIATSYPNTVEAFLNKHKIKAKIHEINGSVELATTLGLAESICDLVSTGDTLAKNGLVEVYTLFHSEVCLFKNEKISNEKIKILNQLVFRIDSVLQATESKYILMNVPDNKIAEVLKILPGIKSPTVLPLALKGWSSIHTVVQKNNFWEIINRLKAAGAEGILILSLENMIL